MKLQFKHQKFQADAAKAVVDVFKGQPYLTPSYRMDTGRDQTAMGAVYTDTGWRNEPVVPELSDQMILDNLRQVQRANLIRPSDKLEGRFNLTIEMETGVGKTYTYIKTMYELNAHYGWTKFIVVVPSIAIREGVYKSFQVTRDHFAQEYGKKIRFFIYNSKQLTEIDRFASDSAINVMIINSQAFNATGKDARRIRMKLDEFRSRRPIDIIAKTNPILIIDEPQSVEGKKTKEGLIDFNPMITLRYSATHKADAIYNMVYRLDAMEAYNKRLVKRIAVKGISQSGNPANRGYVYLEGIRLSKADPEALISFDFKGKKGIRKVTKKLKEGHNLYDQSGQLEEYKDGYVISAIDGRDGSVEFLNGLKLYDGDVVGQVSEEDLRRIQIRETILSHFERERALFHKGIKVLSLFFIDEVAKYKQYDKAGQVQDGIYAQIFEEEYQNVLDALQKDFGSEAYWAYLDAIPAEKTHAGYFSIDKKGKMIDPKAKGKEKLSDDVDAYDLIMKNKELLLDGDPVKSPVRFIFSHSALREGWDNPNVFQICTLKQSGSDVRKRQEVGRGLRLCVNREGERMDATVLGEEVQNVNILTVIASESYDDFARGLQTELAQAVGHRPTKVTADLFVDRVIQDAAGNAQVIDQALADAIFYGLIIERYIDKAGALTDLYEEDKANEAVKLCEEVAGYEAGVLEILASVYDGNALVPKDARKDNVELKVDRDKLAMPEFKALWDRISPKTIYVVDFDSKELVDKAIDKLNDKLKVPKVFFKVETGSLGDIGSKEDLQEGKSFVKEKAQTYEAKAGRGSGSGVSYDLIGKIVEGTGLTRRDVVAILKGMKPLVFNQFAHNPEEFILKATALINEEKATAIVEHIAYDLTDDTYSTSIFTEPTIRGQLEVNAIKAQKHLYDHLVYDSTKERAFAEDMDRHAEVAVYVKLPGGFYISTPVGKYSPDWAIAFYEGTVKHIYFVAETKGSMSTMDLRDIEKAKIACARKHFRAISGDQVVYEVVDSYDSLLEILKS